MLILNSASIRFDTHGDAKDPGTTVHVFLKNRLNNSLSPQQNTDFISNLLALRRYLDATGDINPADRNPYLAYGMFLGEGVGFDDPSSQPFQLTLVSQNVDANDIVLPEINIHILANGDDRWIFDYFVELDFANDSPVGIPFHFTSAINGIQGIILDQDNRNYSGIGIEIPPNLRSRPIPVPTKADTNALLKRVTLEFSTHGDPKDASTRLNVHIVNRLSSTSEQDIAIGLDLFKDQEFPASGTPDDKYRAFSWSSDDDATSADGTLASNTIRLADMVLPVVYIVIVPNDNDRWIFDYRMTFQFEDPQDFGQKRRNYSSQISGVILDQDNNKHEGVYQGRPFPTVAPPTAPKLTYQPVDHTGRQQKRISIPFVRRKFDEFINNRNGPVTAHNPPLRMIHLGSKGSPAGGTPLPESYVDTQAINAGDDDKVHYVSSPKSLGQLYNDHGLGDAFIRDIDSATLGLTIPDVQQAAPLTLTVDFAPGGRLNIDLIGDVTLKNFSITLKLTLDLAISTNQFGSRQTVVDLMSWVTDLQNMNTANVGSFNLYTGTFLHQPVNVTSPQSKEDLFLEQVLKVSLTTDSAIDPQRIIRTSIRDQIYSYLTKPDVITKTTPRDDINSMVTSWLLGGVADDRQNTDNNNAVIQSIGIENANPELGIPEDTLVISYAGPQNIFVPQRPTDWPAGHDFSPGTLANIDHIVVLMMENRSFDHMLGYLSLPASKNGMGRQDVDGLKGNEFNSHNGQPFPSFELTSTIFSPDPPHGYEPVHHAINGGRMDGFVDSYAEGHGEALAGNIMGYHTGANVPNYDALARDFAIGHRWFASHPGPTFCNRFYELTGRLNLDPRGFWEFDNSSPLRPVYTPTIFDYLSNAVDPQTGQPCTWRYFEHGYCFLRFFEGHTFDASNIVSADDPEVGFFASAQAGRLPNVSFIDPHFIEYPPDGNCDGPPSDVRDGQAFVKRVVEAVIASPAWHKTLLLIVYDEHGGFFDHVPPPAAAPVSDDLSIRTTGVRVPAFVISPWVGAGTVFGHDGITGPGGGGTNAGRFVRPGADLHYDHTSILKTIARRFLSTNPPYMGARYAAANDLVIGTQLRQPQFLPFIRYRLQFAVSGMMLDVKLANRAPGTILQQLAADGSVAQDFSFEDAGGGFVYIRSQVSNLYVTVPSADTVLTGGHAATNGDAGSGSSNTANTPGSGVIQDVKYTPLQIDSSVKPRPALQMWKLTSASQSPLERDLYVISNQAYPTLVLQPANPSQSQTLIVLGPADGGTGGIQRTQKSWKVTSPLFSDGTANA